MGVYRAKLLANPDLFAEFERQNMSFAARRWQLLSAPDREYSEVSGYTKILKDSGVCGLQYMAQVKCLHAHYAHWLATGDNIVGAWVADALRNGDDLQSLGEKFKSEPDATPP